MTNVQFEDQQYGGSAQQPYVDPSQKGIIGFLMQKGIAKNVQQANIILFGIIGVCIAIAAIALWPDNPPPPAEYQQEAIPAGPGADDPINDILF